MKHAPETLHAASDLTSLAHRAVPRGGRQGDRPRLIDARGTASITRARCRRTRSRRDAILSDDVGVINLFAATPAPSLVGGTRQAGRSAPRPARRCRCWRGGPSNSFANRPTASGVRGG
jgi:hypothetical protein